MIQTMASDSKENCEVLRKAGAVVVLNGLLEDTNERVQPLPLFCSTVSKTFHPLSSSILMFLKSMTLIQVQRLKRLLLYISQA